MHMHIMMCVGCREGGKRVACLHTPTTAIIDNRVTLGLDMTHPSSDKHTKVSFPPPVQIQRSAGSLARSGHVMQPNMIF